jgi:hypothetical protein
VELIAIYNSVFNLLSQKLDSSGAQDREILQQPTLHLSFPMRKSQMSTSWLGTGQFGAGLGSVANGIRGEGKIRLGGLCRGIVRWSLKLDVRPS